MTYLMHYPLKEQQGGIYERGEGTVHGTEFGGDPELFISETVALADFEDWLRDCYPDGVERDDTFIGWGVVYRCQTQDDTRLVSVDVEEEEKD